MAALRTFNSKTFAARTFAARTFRPGEIVTPQASGICEVRIVRAAGFRIRRVAGR